MAGPNVHEHRHLCYTRPVGDRLRWARLRISNNSTLSQTERRGIHGNEKIDRFHNIVYGIASATIEYRPDNRRSLRNQRDGAVKCTVFCLTNRLADRIAATGVTSYSLSSLLELTIMSKKTIVCYGLSAVFALGASGCSKPFGKETAQNQKMLAACFDQGDKYGDLYQTAKDAVSPASPSAGIFSQENLLAGMSRERYKEWKCSAGKEVAGKGLKCEQACRYGFVFPHSFSGGIKLDELWREEDFRLRDGSTSSHTTGGTEAPLVAAPTPKPKAGSLTILETFTMSVFCRQYRCTHHRSWPLTTGATNHSYDLSLPPTVVIEIPTKDEHIESYGIIFYEHDPLSEADLNAIDTLLRTIDAPSTTPTVRQFVRANIERDVAQILQAKSKAFGHYRLWAGKVGNNQIVHVEPIAVTRSTARVEIIRPAPAVLIDQLPPPSTAPRAGQRSSTIATDQDTSSNTSRRFSLEGKPLKSLVSATPDQNEGWPTRESERIRFGRGSHEDHDAEYPLKIEFRYRPPAARVALKGDDIERVKLRPSPEIQSSIDGGPFGRSPSRLEAKHFVDVKMAYADSLNVDTFLNGQPYTLRCQPEPTFIYNTTECGRIQVPSERSVYSALLTLPLTASVETPLRVGGPIKQPTQIRDVRPIYPRGAESSRVQGVVILEAVIATDGKVKEAKVLRSIPLLDQAALDAVKQWQFTPTTLNGVPVSVIMIVTVNFTLQ